MGKNNSKTTKNNKVKNEVKDTKAKEQKTKPEVQQPTVSADGSKIETPKVEEVKKPKAENVKTLKAGDLLDKLTDKDTMDANHAAIFLDTLERRTARMDRSKPLTIQMENVLDYNMLWFGVKLSLQTYKQRGEFKMLTPNDDFIVQQTIDMASSMGIALSAHPTEDGKQLEMQFTDIPEDVKKEAEAEIKAEEEEKNKKVKHRTLTPEQLRPENWKNDEDAVAALRQEMLATHESPSNKFLRILNMIKVYKENTETDELKKDLWGRCSLTDLAEEYQRLLDKRGMVVINGLMSSVVNSLKCGETMIFAHCLLKKNMPQLSDQEIAELVKMFIRIKHGDDSQPIEEDPAVVNGILKPKIDTFVRIVMNRPTQDKSYGEDESWFKKVNNVLFISYKDEIGSRTIENPETKEISANPTYTIKAVNKMIEIRNLYVDKNAHYKLVTQEEFNKLTNFISK